MDGQMSGRVCGSKDESSGWMHGWMDEWVGGCMYEWVDG